MGESIADLLDRAKRGVAAGNYRAAADAMAAAADAGATQRQIASGIGRSASKVNELLKWRAGGYRGSPTALSHEARSKTRAERAEQAKRQADQAPDARAVYLFSLLNMAEQGHAGAERELLKEIPIKLAGRLPLKSLEFCKPPIKRQIFDHVRQFIADAYGPPARAILQAMANQLRSHQHVGDDDDYNTDKSAVA